MLRRRRSEVLDTPTYIGLLEARSSSLDKDITATKREIGIYETCLRVALSSEVHEEEKLHQKRQELDLKERVKLVVSDSYHHAAFRPDSVR